MEGQKLEVKNSEGNFVLKYRFQCPGSCRGLVPGCPENVKMWTDSVSLLEMV
jgi:hypothetical protein